MLLNQKQRNKFTVGKWLRSLKRLGKEDSTAKIVDMSPELQGYYNQLIEKGLQVKNLRFAIFETKNGLKYPGLVATQKILANTILMKVPVECLLTTRDAFLSDVEKIFLENPAFYAKNFSQEWEDRILLTFLLYEYQKGKDSKWWNLIRNLPREIDYAIFWTEEEIRNLEDENLQKHIKVSKQKFEETSKDLIKILERYPQYFSAQTIKKQNLIWLHTHLVTRCFGKYFEYTTMVPFAQLFNHECVDVYYTMYYKPGNPYDQKEQFYQQKQLTNEELDECNSSDGSYQADDFEDQDQFVEQIVDGDEWQINAVEYGQQVGNNIKNYINYMYTLINLSDSISLHYVKIVLQEFEKVKYIQGYQLRNKKCLDIHNLNIQYIKKIRKFYQKLKLRYYSEPVKQIKIMINSPKKVEQPEQNVNYFSSPWQNDKFDEFYMLCSSRDQFDKGSQVFFCYGRLPNKLLLMRYGIALEHNKYDHLFIRINVSDDVLKSKVMRAALKEIQIKKYKRFKVKRTKFCTELITYFRMLKWSYEKDPKGIFKVLDCESELQVLVKGKQLIVQQLNKYENEFHVNEKKLSQKNLGYHEYFGLVYKVEQQRILMEQIKMIDYGLHVIGLIKSGMKLKQILSDEKQRQILMYQIMMQNYFKMFGVGVQGQK